jgi:hypothetical protein
MYFSADEVSRLWTAADNGGTPKPVLIKQPFSKPITTDRELLDILKIWADAGRHGRAVVSDISYIDADALPGATDRTLDDSIQRIERAWDDDWFAYVTDVHQYDGTIWERAIEILLPAVRRNGGLPAGGFRIEGFFGKYRSTPTGIHLDSSDNFSFIVRGPKRLLFWPRERFQPRVQIPDPRAPSQELALTRRYEDHVSDAIILDGEEGDVIYWPRDYWHVGASPEGWTAMINLAMWWNARPITLARFVLNRVLHLDGEPSLHAFNPDAVLDQVSTPPPTLIRPVRDAASQVFAESEYMAHAVWANVTTSYGFTLPPSKRPVPAVANDMRVRVKHPILLLQNNGTCALAACGRQTATSLRTVHGCALLNEAPGAEYAVQELIDIFTGGTPATDDATQQECRRVIGELIAFRAIDAIDAVQ